MSSVPDQHRARSSGISVRCAVITCTDSRSEKDDRSGALIRKLLMGAGHEISSYRVVREDPGQVSGALQEAANGADAIILNGGTGVSPRDGTVEAVNDFIDQELRGFGELFRSLSYAEIGSAAMLSRAVAGVGGGVAVFAIPGSTAAVDLAMTKLIIPELRHLVGLLGE